MVLHGFSFGPKNALRKPAGIGVERCFSLIEILVVMSIIALLTAMTAPALASAKDKARKTSCMNNLRQIGGAFQMYLNDHDDTYPPCVYYTGWLASGFVDTDNDIQWVLKSYLGGTNSMDSKIWVCPSAAKYGYPFNPPGLKKFGAPSAWNYKHDITYRYSQNPRDYPPAKLTRLRTPSKAALMWDLPDDFGASYSLAHMDSVDCLFADGHVAPTPVVPGLPNPDTLQWYEESGADRGWEGIP